MAKTYSQLDRDGRRTLFRLVEARRPVGEIAERLGRHRSTVYRELGRNRFRDGDRGSCGYFPLTAHDMARGRRRRRRKLAADDALRAHVVERLRAGWSPQQIAGRLKREAPDRPSVCHETIYRHVYGPDGRRDGLYRHLPKARRRRGGRYGRKPRATPIPRERRIENRPTGVERRESFGHWECDLLLFRKETGKANVTSLIERKSRFTLLLPNDDRRSTAVLAGVAGALRGLPEAARRTVTFDRGSEFAAYAALDRHLALASHSCDPHRSYGVAVTAGRASVPASPSSPDGDVRCRSDPRKTRPPRVPRRPSSSSPWR
jgi:IS30 family transposase